MKITEIISEETNMELYDASYKEESKERSVDFTRERKMSFEELVIFIIMRLRGNSTNSALRRFFERLGVKKTMKQQSFSEARQKIKVSAFIVLYRITVRVMLSEGRKFSHGFRVMAIDGSTISLPMDLDLLRYYGGCGAGASSPSARGSILYDVLNDIVVDAHIEPLSVDERTLADRHLNACKERLGDDKKLLIFDSGYPSFELIDKLETDGFHYVMRVKSKFNNEVDAQSKPDGYVYLTQGEKRIKVRVIKFLLDSGEEEVLLSNIMDKRLGTKAFKKLYFMRWPVETKYDIVKNKLQLENFTSLTRKGVEQDFYACMYLTNVTAAAAIDAQEEIDKLRTDKDNKYEYKANTNELIGILKDHFVYALIQEDADTQAAIIQDCIDMIKQYVIPIRIERSVQRNNHSRDVKFHHNQKCNS
jgi:hypothetical protein